MKLELVDTNLLFKRKGSFTKFNYTKMTYQAHFYFHLNLKRKIDILKSEM